MHTNMGERWSYFLTIDAQNLAKYPLPINLGAPPQIFFYISFCKIKSFYSVFHLMMIFSISVFWERKVMLVYNLGKNSFNLYARQKC